MKAKMLFYFVLLFFISCGSQHSKETEKSASDDIPVEQLNISILLDLSDRLVQPLEPDQPSRDIEVVSVLIDVFKSRMQSKGAFMSKDKFRVLFNPIPSDPNINNLSKSLNFDLSKLDNKQKKEVYDNIETDIETSLKEIYKITTQNKDWIGSDVWRFFKNDAKDLCIENDLSYRNVLVILTDGYIYHQQSIERQKNKTSYITGNFLQNEGFRNNPNWKSKLESENYGLIVSDDCSLEKLEVIVLEINPSPNHLNDEDIIKGLLTKWFNEMNISNFVIYNTDLPQNTKKRVENFFKN
jgi:hypothetical protein